MDVVYFIHEENDFEYFKIGVTRDINDRIRTLQCGNRRKLLIYETISCSSKFNLENLLHKHLSEFRVSGEWFRINKEHVDKLINSVQSGTIGSDENTINIKNLVESSKRKRLTWEERYDFLVEYVKEHNEIPSLSAVHNDYKVGLWVMNQRVAYKNKNLSQEKINKLESINGWKWQIENYNIEIWKRNVEILNLYIEVFNELPETNDKVYFSFNIGNWIYHQRMRYRKKTLKDWQIKTLEEFPNWKWENDTWLQSFTLLSEFVEIYDCLPNYKNKLFKQHDLLVWCASQKSRYKKQKLSSEQIEKLVQKEQKAR